MEPSRNHISSYVIEQTSANERLVILAWGGPIEQSGSTSPERAPFGNRETNLGKASVEQLPSFRRRQPLRLLSPLPSLQSQWYVCDAIPTALFATQFALLTRCACRVAVRRFRKKCPSFRLLRSICPPLAPSSSSLSSFSKSILRRPPRLFSGRLPVPGGGARTGGRITDRRRGFLEADWGETDTRDDMETTCC